MTPIVEQGLSPVTCEIVIVDDSSTDNSTHVLDQFLDIAGTWAGQRCKSLKSLCLPFGLDVTSEVNTF